MTVVMRRLGPADSSQCSGIYTAGCMRILLTACVGLSWSIMHCPMHAGLAHTEHLWKFASDLAPLAGSLASRDSRAALAAAFAALAQLLPGLQQCSALLTDLNAMSTTEVCLHVRI